MILTAADPMAKATNRSVATRLAYLGVRSRKAAENSAQQEVRVEMTSKIPMAAMVKARRRKKKLVSSRDAALASKVAISGEPPQMPPPPAKSPSSTIPPKVASPPDEVAISCEPP
ncbi:hypothetical protein TIFTF001_050967 [Ficus carica]|uniref:Uncharacterized protein n=1 Tax=Ficus carica TaxID=3494 RepID=A0AA87YR85_FICCA|nr:hypothetical protein TIFTF001_050967 [Ficus carica]